MTVGAAVIDQQVQQTSAIAAAGGTAQFDIAIATDTVVIVWAKIVLSRASGGHIAAGAGLLATAVVENRNGATSFSTALAGSVNPDNSGGLVGAGAEASSFSAAPTGNLTVTANKLRLTVTNNDATFAADCTVFFDIYQSASS
jgi:hypothetical protein